MTCTADKTHTVDLGVSDTVQDVKTIVEAREGKVFYPMECSWLTSRTQHALSYFHRLFAGIPCSEQRVMFAGRQLDSDTSLAAAGVSDASTMYILMRLLGGAKKRKKKTYTKPKKQKHKHKKIKLAVLKFYKVNILFKLTCSADNISCDLDTLDTGSNLAGL